MQRLEENRDVEKRKKEAIGGSNQHNTTKKGKLGNGFQLFHMILAALLSLLIGAIF
jgi:hypothetical protein